MTLNTTTRTGTGSVLAGLRSLVPHRGLSFGEALRIADLQATRLRELTGATDDTFPEEAIAGLPRIRIVRRRIPTSGVSYWDGQEWIIALNSREPEARQRFTLMHEYKHIVDHGGTDRLYTGTQSTGADKQAEQAADYFAGCVLMPRVLVKRDRRFHRNRPGACNEGSYPAPIRQERRHGVWTVRSARIDETAEVIADVVGMGLAQFQRIALLPQGQFADFLRADARERHRLLTALFDVGALEDVESWLAEQRRSSGERLARSEHELGYLWRTLTDLLAGLGAGGETTTEDGPAPPFAPAEWLPDTALEERDWRGEVERIRAGGI